MFANDADVPVMAKKFVAARDVPVADPISGVVRVGDVAKTLFPVPVFVTLIRLLEASVAIAEDAVSGTLIVPVKNMVVALIVQPAPELYIAQLNEDRAGVAFFI